MYIQYVHINTYKYILFNVDYVWHLILLLINSAHSLSYAEEK